MTRVLEDIIRELVGTDGEGCNNGFRDSYIDFLTGLLNCEVSGMDAENKQREIQGESIAYVIDHYHETYEKYNRLYEDYQKLLRRSKRG